MATIEKEIYKNMLDKLVSNNVLTQFFADQMASFIEHKKYGYKVKRYITELVSLLSLFEGIHEAQQPKRENQLPKINIQI